MRKRIYFSQMVTDEVVQILKTHVLRNGTENILPIGFLQERKGCVRWLQEREGRVRELHVSHNNGASKNAAPVNEWKVMMCNICST